MAKEPNQAKWVGVRPTDPEEPFTVKQGTAANLKATVIGVDSIPIKVKQNNASNLKVQATLKAGQSIGVTQATPANLKATVIGDDATPIKVKQGTAANLKVEAAIAAAQSIAVTQSTPANLKATVIGDDATPIKVKQDTAANLKATVTPEYILQGDIAGFVTNPADQAILVNSNPLTAGRYNFTVIATASVNHMFFQVMHMNAANDAFLHKWLFGLSAYSPFNLRIPNWNIATNERMTVNQYRLMTGEIALSLVWTKFA